MKIDTLEFAGLFPALEKKIYYLYGLKDNIDNKIKYVGVTSNLEQRLKDHLKKSHYKENIYKSNWIKDVYKNGGTIQIEILCICNNIDDCFLKEQEYIKNNEGLTNITKGGKGSLGIKPSDETKYKIGSANRGKCISKLYGESVSNGLKQSYLTGKRKMSKEQLEKMNIASKLKNSKVIYQYDKNYKLITSYNSVTEAAKTIKCANTTLSDCANGRTKTAKGFIWKYKKITDED